MRGTLEGEELVLTTELVEASYVLRPSGTDRLLDRIDATGPSPYFFVSIKIKSLGGLVDERPDETPREMVIDDIATERADSLGDDRVELSIRLSNGSESQDFPGVREQGSFRVTTQSLSELGITFEVVFNNPGDRLEGCATIRPTEVRTLL